MEPALGANLLLGPNGAGKTNVLEAVHLVLTGFSHRAGRDAEMVAHGREAFSVRARVERDRFPGDLVPYQVTYVTRHKTVKRGDLSLTGKARTAAMGAAVVFSPDDLGLVKGAPSLRRSYMDGVATKAAPGFRSVCRRYEAALAHRNRLLNPAAGEAPDEQLIAPFTEQLTALGAAILDYRLRCLERLIPLVCDAYTRLAGPLEQLVVHYALGDEDLGSPPLAGTEEGVGGGAGGGKPGIAREILAARLAAAFQEAWAEERARRVTLVGPHRDDLRLDVNGRPARIYASQGQQRSVALALRLAEAAFVETVLEEKPVLLLDDVFSELDQARRDALLGILRLAESGYQTFVTATDMAGVPRAGLGAVARFAIAAGRVIPDA